MLCVSLSPKADWSSSTSAPGGGKGDSMGASDDIRSSPVTSGSLGAWGLVFLAGFKK